MGLSYMKCAHPGCEEVRELTKAFCAGHQKQNDDQLDALRAFEREVLERAAQVCEKVATDPNLDYRDERCAEDVCAEHIRALVLPDEELRKWAKKLKGEK